MAHKSAEKTVEVNLDLGNLKPAVKRAARNAGIGVNEFIVNALEWRIAQDRYNQSENFTPHGGKHLYGKSTGYELTSDGKYYPAPSWTNQFDVLFAERSAAYNLVNYIVAQSESRLRDIERRIQETKKGLIEDLGLDPKKDWAYYGTENYLIEHEPKGSDEEHHQQ